ncbi:META domain-containing protein [Chryseobacterium chendengshani]|uniref:hypothetical protein n=1 Tax=Chryseobacterium sp. LJ756 TaxID=2864113 RepID=UPI001C64015C|nr:hypothetical protein [Chryseobacterium sp. LJ756]MBW7676569.1 hypothetical protein [Chryseobacterium sp. LJ756]
MKKLTLIMLFSAFSFISNLYAQTNSLAKTTWKVETVRKDGSAVFSKMKTIKFPSEEPQFHYLQFDGDKEYHTGNACFGMLGTYSIQENNQIEISEGTADMSSDCKEPETFIGTYYYKIDKDRLELIPVKN